MDFARHVPSKEGLFRTKLIIASCDPLPIVFYASQSEQNSAAWIRRLREFQRDLDSRGTKLRRRDTIVHERNAQRHVIALTSSGRKRRKVSRQHRGSRNEGCVVRRILAYRGALVSAEEEQPVFDERTANRAAELAPLQRIPFRREEISGVELAVAHELEKIPVELIRSRFGHAAHLRAGVSALLRILCTCGHFELLQCIREGKRHARRVVEIAVRCAIERICHSIT